MDKEYTLVYVERTGMGSRARWVYLGSPGSGDTAHDLSQMLLGAVNRAHPERYDPRGSEVVRSHCSRLLAAMPARMDIYEATISDDAGKELGVAVFVDARLVGKVEKTIVAEMGERGFSLRNRWSIFGDEKESADYEFKNGPDGTNPDGKSRGVRQ